MKHTGKIVIKSTESGDLYFNVVAENGSILGSSKIYEDRDSLNKGLTIMQQIFSEENLTIVEIPIDSEEN